MRRRGLGPQCWQASGDACRRTTEEGANTPDDTTKTGGQDRRRISTSEDYEVRDWAAKFGVTKEQLLESVKQVGDLATDVEAHLKGRRK